MASAGLYPDSYVAANLHGSHAPTSPVKYTYTKVLCRRRWEVLRWGILRCLSQEINGIDKNKALSKSDASNRNQLIKKETAQSIGAIPLYSQIQL